MKRQLSLFSAALLLSATTSFSQTTTASSDPVGFVTVTVPAQSDAVLAVPLNRSAVFKGVIQSISGSTITVAGTSPGWATAPQQFVQSLTQINTYAVQLASGTKEGMIGKITANTANSVTIQLEAGDDLSGVKTEAVDGVGLGDHVDIMPFWTPSALLGNLVAGTEFLGFENVSAGVNKSSSELYGATGSGWEDGDTSADVSNVPIAFGRGFVLRNNSGTALSTSMVGTVPMVKSRVRLSNLAVNTDQDIRFGFTSPVPESITTLGIPATDGDAIFAFNNSAIGKNKSAAFTYTYDGLSSSWIDEDLGGPIDSTVKLQPGFGYLYRKFRKSGVNPQSVVWQKLPSYLQ